MDIFDTEVFITRNCCGQWGHWSYLAIGSDLVIALAYLGIPWYMWSRQLITGNPKTIVPVTGFVAFILACGVGHICECLSWIWPAYRLFTIIDFTTACISVFVFAFMPLLAPLMISRWREDDIGP